MSLESSPPKGGLILVMGFLRVSVLQVFMLHPGLGVVLQVLQIVGLGKVMHLGELHGIGWYVEDLYSLLQVTHKNWVPKSSVKGREIGGVLRVKLVVYWWVVGSFEIERTRALGWNVE